MKREARRRKTPRYRSLLLHWLGQAFKRPEPARTTASADPEAGQVAITFGGHATALCRFAGAAIACDPMLGMWAGPARRELAPGVTVSALAAARVILITSRHRDHLHRKTLAAIASENRGNATVALPPGAASQISGLGFRRVVELSPGTGFADGDVEITAVEARPGLGYVIRGDGPSVLFCGDGGYFSGFAKIGEIHAPSIALLPISGFSPDSLRRRHMSPPDALRAFADLRARLMIPVRHGSFALSYEHIDAPLAWLAELAATRDLDERIAMLACGETRVFSQTDAVDFDIDVDVAAPVNVPEPEPRSDPEPEPEPAEPRPARAVTGSDIAAAARAAAERGSR